MKAWKKTLLAVSGSLIGAGVICMGIGLACGGSYHYTISIPGGYTASSRLSGEAQTVTDLGRFSGVDISLDVGTLKVCTTDGEAAYFTTSVSEAQLQYFVENGVLTISVASSSGSNGFYFLSPDSFTFGFGSTQAYTSEGLTLYLPRDMDLNTVDISAEHGDVSLSGLPCETLTVTVDSGDLAGESLTCDSLSLFCDYGDMTLSDCSTEMLDIQLSAGDCDLQNVTAETAELYNEYGDVRFCTAVLGMGNITLDCGDLVMTALSVTDSLSITNDFGDIALETADGIEAYTYQATTEFGDVSVGAEGSGLNSQLLESAPALEIFADCGDITLQ